jgi:hypothetical protein
MRRWLQMRWLRMRLERLRGLRGLRRLRLLLYMGTLRRLLNGTQRSGPSIFPLEPVARPAGLGSDPDKHYPLWSWHHIACDPSAGFADCQAHLLPDELAGCGAGVSSTLRRCSDLPVFEKRGRPQLLRSQQHRL